MKRILTIIASLAIIFSCGPGKHVSNDSKQNKTPEMFTAIEKLMSYSQLDSLCKADLISSSPSDWDKMYFVNDDNSIITEYMYVAEKQDTLFIYTAVESGDSLFVTKRVQIGE